MAQERFQTEKLSDYFTWVKAVWVTARGNPLEFENRPYLEEVYRDQHKHIVYLKAAQMGLSERSISEAVWACDQLGVNTLYTFPTMTHLQDFVQARIDPVLNISDYLKSRSENRSDGERSIMKIALKKIGRGFLYLRGSQNEKQIITIDADVVFMDERDRFLQENVPYIEKRLLASKLKWIREISTPTYPGQGIHASYLKSDQRVWQIQCKKCEHWMELDFFKHVDFQKRTVRCDECKSVVNRLAKGRWLPTNPDSKIHGYKINGLYNPSMSIGDIIDKYDEASSSGYSSLQQFFNQILGIPYEVNGQKLTISELDECKRDYMMPYMAKSNVFAGADVGVSVIHSVVLQKLPDDRYRIIWAGTVKNFEGPQSSLQAIMDKYDVNTMVVDKKPETQKLKELMKLYPRKIYAATYPNMNFSVKEYYLFDDINLEVRLDRTISLDYIIGDIQGRKIEFPKNIESVREFYTQLTNSVRITEKNARTGIENSRWIEKGDDHYLHALNYARIAQIRGTVGKALVDYYTKPNTINSPNFIDWLRVNGRRIF